MASIKQFNYKRFLLAMIFLLLNFLCIASPVINLNNDNNTEAVSLQFGYNLNNIETEPNPITVYSYKNGLLQFSSLKNTTAPYSYLKNKVQFFTPDPVVSRILSRSIPEPGYYSLLFIYSLF